MRKHHLLLLTVTSVMVLGLVAYVTVGRYFLERGTTTPVPLHEIEQRYFASTTTTPVPAATPAPVATSGVPRSASPSSDPPPAPAVLPAPGVYLYATTGGDRIDALNGDHHDYPATTTITVTTGGCGVQQRWDVVEERWEAWQRCLGADGASVAEPARTNYDEFFSNGVRDESTCTGDPRPLHPGDGTAWTTTCVDAEGSAETHAGVVVGPEQRSVGADQVSTMHVTTTITDDDPANLQTIDTWYLDGTDLVVAQTSTDHTVNSSPIGNVNYDEHYAIELTELTPVT